MFIGHFAVAFAGKKLAPRATLPALIFAASFADILWPILVAVGAEHVRIVPGITRMTPLDLYDYPWSHSLLMLAVWGGLFAAFFRKQVDGLRTGAVIGLLVVSHWFLDWITHRPDMPLYPGGPEYGLGLWNSIPGTMVVEIAMFVVGVVLYERATEAKDAIGTWGFRLLASLLLGFFIADALDDTVPPSVEMIWMSALIATGILLLWAGWVDRHRSNEGREPSYRI